MSLKNTIRIILREEISLPIHVRRRIRYNDNDIIAYLKKFALRNSDSDELRRWNKGKRIEIALGKSCADTAYEILDSTQLPYDGDDSFHQYMGVIANYLKEKYGEEIKKFMEDFYSDDGDELGSRYVFEKHSERHGGNGFSEGYETWNQLLRAFASWFPDLDWKELKMKLDNMKSGGKILIKKPGDINNTMGYYFSLQRFDVPNKKIKESVLKEALSDRDEKYKKRWESFVIFMKRRDGEIKDTIVEFADKYRNELKTVKIKFIAQAVMDEVIESFIRKNNITDENIYDWIYLFIEDNYTGHILNELEKY